MVTAFLGSCYPRASRHITALFVRDIRKLSIILVLALYVDFGHGGFEKGHVPLFTQELADLRLVGLLTLEVMTFCRFGDLLVLLRYPEQLQGSMRESCISSGLFRAELGGSTGTENTGEQE